MGFHLDALTTAIHFGLLEVEDVLRIIGNKPPNPHLILTGRKAAKELIEIADLVTEMRDVKHHYNQGVIAQKGIEY